MNTQHTPLAIAAAIFDTMRRGGAPLTDDQRMLLVGCLAVWLDKYAEQQRDELQAKYDEILNALDDAALALEVCNCDYRAKEIARRTVAKHRGQHD